MGMAAILGNETSGSGVEVFKSFTIYGHDSNFGQIYILSFPLGPEAA